MSKLISCEEAKLAWARGEQIEVSHAIVQKWGVLNDSYMLSVFNNGSYIFRKKPRTITVNGIEVPAPFEPKEGEKHWIISGEYYNGYISKRDPNVAIAAWRTEEEIKQVVAALRSVFGKK